MTPKRIRRIAVNEIIVREDIMPQNIIEIAGGIVKSYYPFTDEQPCTEWIGGTVEIKTDEHGYLRVYKNENLIE